MAVTLKDIAAAAGVSIGTVDRALKNRGRIKPEVAERIRTLAKEMNYQTNTVASGLVNRSKKYMIAVVLNILNDFWNEVVKGINQAKNEIRDYAIDVKIYSSGSFDDQKQLELIEKALAEGANALVIAPVNSPLISKRIRELNSKQFPVVFLNTYINRLQVFSSIHCDYYRTGRIAGALVKKLSVSPDKVLVILPPGQVLGNHERQRGIAEYFKENPAEPALAEIIEMTNRKEEDISRIVSALQGDKEIHNIIYNGDTGVLTEVVSRIDRPFTTVAFDLSKDSRRALLDGVIDAIVGQSQQEQGYEAINVLFQYLTAGKAAGKKILISSDIYIRECIE